MLILGIETSCDETAIAVVKNNRILSNSVSSSIHLHRRFGGVIPEIACRYHVEYINYVLKDALKHASIGLDKIDLIAVTERPGLIGALLVGISIAKALSLAKGIPLIGVDHLIAHLYAVFMNDAARVQFPFVGIVVSGGHTNLFRINDVDRYKLLGQTRDDAAGEAFDKVAKLLNLGYPGGPIIEKRARRGKIDKTLFSRNDLSKTLDFSFSGIKTAVLYHIRDRLKEKGLLRKERNKARDISKYVVKIGIREIDNVAASFQDAVTDILVEKAVTACRRERLNKLVVGGGVSSNTQFRNKLAKRAIENGIKLYIPKRQLCLDNAAMVAGLGRALYKKETRSVPYITAQSIGIYR